MRFDWSTFALQAANFAILVWLLQRFLYRPVLRLIDARRGEIDAQYEAARGAAADAAAQREAVAAERAGIAAERAAALKQAAAEAESVAAARREAAERDAAALLDAARKTLADERGKAMAEARRAALDLGADIAARFIAEVPAKLRAEAWIERIEQYLAGLPKEERDALISPRADTIMVRILTAAALPAETAQAWRARLNRTFGNGLDNRLATEFSVDSDLVAGAELHFPNAVLRFSFQSALAAMRAEIEADGVAC